MQSIDALPKESVELTVLPVIDHRSQNPHQVDHPSSLSRSAASAHVPGKETAKTVVGKIDGALEQTVLPTFERVDFAMLEIATRTRNVAPATEDEFRSRFPDCKVGAMPPFGNLFGMKTYVAAELIRLSYEDFERPVAISRACGRSLPDSRDSRATRVAR